MALIRFLIIFAVIYYGFKLLSRIILPFLAQYFIKKTNRTMRDHFGAPPRQDQKKEGEITIDKPHGEKRKDPRIDDDAGEYVDYEEIE